MVYGSERERETFLTGNKAAEAVSGQDPVCVSRFNVWCKVVQTINHKT